MYKIVITGPESTGKSTLSKQLADYFKVEKVAEFARAYLEKLDCPYTQKDLTTIAKGQIECEEKALKMDVRLIICDTSLEVIKIWSEFKYGSCDPFITSSLVNRQPDLYLLMKPDLPWQPDPLRENPKERDELFELYKEELISSGVPYYEVSGNGEVRFEIAKEAIYKTLGIN